MLQQKLDYSMLTDNLQQMKRLFWKMDRDSQRFDDHMRR